MTDTKTCRFITPVLLLDLLCAPLHPNLAHAAEAAAGSASASTEVAGAPAAVAGTSLSESLAGVAKEHYENARLLFENHDYAGALLKFQLSYDASHDARLLWNIAACEKQQRHYARMTVLIEQYLKDGGALVNETERSNAQTVLDTLQPFVGQLEFKVNEPDAALYVDDEKVGTSPVSVVRVDMGTRKIRVTKDGFDDWYSTQNVVGGTTVPVAVELKKVHHAGTLRIVTDGAYDVLVDGARVGVGNWSGELPSGTHTLDVRGNGMLPYQSEVVVTDKQTNLVRVTLRPEPVVAASQSSGSHTWLWVAGGTLLAAGLATGADFVFRPSDPGRPPPVGGTMRPWYVQLP